MTAEGKPRFSIIVPTRGRPERLRRLLDSFRATTRHPDELEIITVVDADDTPSLEFDYHGVSVKRVIVQPGLTMGALNMHGYRAAHGKYLMLLNDDVIVRTRGWDDAVLHAFESYADEILLVHVNDTIFEEKLCTFPFLSRTYCEFARGICPEDYIRYRIDDHIYNVFNLLAVLRKGRIVYLPDVVFEHTNSALEPLSGIHYRPDERIHALDSRRFDELLPGRKKLALELIEYIDRFSTRDLSRVRTNVLDEVYDSVALRLPEYVSVGPERRRFSEPAPRVTIGVVSANLHSDHARTCIDLIKKRTLNYDLVLLDNNGRPGFNHPHEMNRLIAGCDADFLVLMDDDVFVEPNWLEGMVSAMGPSVGVVTPLHKDRSGQFSYAGIVMRPDDSGHHSHILRIPQQPQRIPTLCSAAMLIDLSKTGYIRFDEAYRKYFFDLDYGLRIWDAGLQVVCSPRAVVTHLGGGTLPQMSRQSEDLFELDRERYLKEWIQTGGYHRLEQSAWRKSAEIRELLDAPSQLQELLEGKGKENPPAFRRKALDFFRSLKDYPALRDWAHQRSWEFIGNRRPDLNDPETGYMAFLLGCLPAGTVLEHDEEGLSIQLYDGTYYAIPASEGLLDYGRVVRGGYDRIFEAEEVDVLKARIRGDLKPTARNDGPTNPVLVEQDFQGLNIIWFQEAYYAIPQTEGAFEQRRFVQGEYSRSYTASTVAELKQRISSEEHPRLIEEGVRGFNIIFFSGTYYAIPQGEGAFEMTRLEKGGYSRTFRARSREELREQIASAPSTATWNEIAARLRAGDWQSAIKPAAKKVVRTALARTHFGGGFSASKPYVSPGDREAAFSAGSVLDQPGTVSAGLSGAHESNGKRPPGKNGGLVKSAGDPVRWVKSSPVTQVEADYRGYGIYSYEYKFFAIPKDSGRFNYNDFKAGKYSSCVIRHSLSELHGALDALAENPSKHGGSRALVLASLPRPVLKPLLDRVYKDETITLLVDQSRGDEWPEFDKIVIDQPSLSDWARSPTLDVSDQLRRLIDRGFQLTVIPWQFPDAFADNSLEVLASKISGAVEVVHVSGRRKVYDGENRHRLIYNKAYLASMFQVVPAIQGQTVLEAGCSDGLVCFILGLLGAERIVGVDVMQTVGCSFPHPAVEYRTMDIARLDFADESFDLVYSIATFEHLPDPPQALLEMLRVTKVGGYAYVQAGPLYHSPFGHHMFGYFQDCPWIHLRKSKDQIIAHAKARGVDKGIERDLAVTCEQYVHGMLNPDHVNGLLLKDYRLEEFRERDDVEVLKYNISYEGRELLTAEIEAEMPWVDPGCLVEHGFEIAFRRLK